ncbi:hypothetical protein NPA31_019120 [Aurantimonas sp. MSK8Z-1]|uniref:hypothetical protein n=1 Tax=Mangrovibrevibacter kandeliae TaxID=2968473 RepID=UPI00211924DB|nr:hypothetical protein [Aurantimonas sp. MSK8Z-1]MCW4117075.1 hypothetical protein [Aurantimonas sp. MSK8Z-1]
MQDYERALAEISEIRKRIAEGTIFRGLGPLALAGTGLLALLTAALQAWVAPDLRTTSLGYFATWIGVAFICVAVIGAEMIGRSRRRHGGLADAMIANAVLQFLPAGIAGAGLAALVYRLAPEAIWMLPGLWQILIALGIFAGLRSFPTGMAIAGAWYFLSGFAALLASVGADIPSPWAMGIPFGIGQFICGLAFHAVAGGRDA